jgi:hypothetical protein
VFELDVVAVRPVLLDAHELHRLQRSQPGEQRGKVRKLLAGRVGQPRAHLVIARRACQQVSNVLADRGLASGRGNLGLKPLRGAGRLGRSLIRGALYRGIVQPIHRDLTPVLMQLQRGHLTIRAFHEVDFGLHYFGCKFPLRLGVQRNLRLRPQLAHQLTVLHGDHHVRTLLEFVGPRIRCQHRRRQLRRVIPWEGCMGQQRRDVRYQVQRVARAQVVVALAVVVLAVPDRRAARAVAGQRVAVHRDRRARVQPDPQQFRMLLHHRGQVILAVARIHVLIDGGIGDQAKPNLVPWRHHDRVVIRVRRAAHHVRALNGRARRSAHHHSTAVEHPEDLLKRQRAEIRIRQPPVPPAFQINAGCVLQRGHKLGRVGHLAIRGVQHRALHPGEDRRAVGRQHLLVFGFGDRRRRDHHDVRGLAAGQRDHPVVVRLSARDNQVALRWPMRRQRRLRYCTPCQRDACQRKPRKHLLRAPVFHSSLPRCICPNTIVPRRIRLQR